MLLERKCPFCSEKRAYVAEEVGNEVSCRRCGQTFVLTKNNARVIWLLLVATLAVMCGGGGVTFRLLRWAAFGPDRSGGLFAPAEEESESIFMPRP